MHRFNDNWDGVERKQSLNEEVLEMKYWTDMSIFAKDIIAYARTLKGKKNLGGFTPEQTTLHQIAGALHQGHEQMQHFFNGLIYHLEGVQKSGKVSDLSMVIRELKKYKKS